MRRATPTPPSHPRAAEWRRPASAATRAPAPRSEDLDAIDEAAARAPLRRPKDPARITE
jgi:hypothetical protein